ncbi:MAG: hypothetical protein KDC32_09685 [Saprospiraceae bacterium]|nr:hypothetical protein [Saprospiraceae bacterium]
MKNLSLLLALLCTTFVPVGAQMSTSPVDWSQIELVGREYKMPPPGFRWWYLTPVAVAPPVIYFFTRKEEGPFLPPTILCLPDQTLECGGPVPPPTPEVLSITVDCPGDYILLSLEDESNGGTGCEGDPRVVVRTYWLQDACGNTATCTQRFTYVVDEEPPEVSCPVDATLECGADIVPVTTGLPLASDNCTPIEQINLGFEDDESGLTGCGGTGIIERTWTVHDFCGNSATCTQKITVEDTRSPSVTCPPDVIVICGESIAPSVTGFPEATDSCVSSDDLTISYEDDLTNQNGCSGYIVREWTVVDPCGNVANCSQVIDLVDIGCDFDPEVAIEPANCTLPDGAITIDGLPTGFTIHWSIGASGAFQNELPAGNYTITIIDATITCSQILDLTIPADPIVYINGVEVIEYACNAPGDILLDLTTPGPGPLVIELQGPSGNIQLNVPPGLVSLGAASELFPGAYIVTVYDQQAGPGCSEQLDVFLAEAPPYPLDLVSVVHPSAPGAADGSISAVVADPLAVPPFTILLNGVPAGTAPDPLLSVTGLAAGTYELMAVDANGCPSMPISILLIAPPGFLVEAGWGPPVWPGWTLHPEEAYSPQEALSRLQELNIEHPPVGGKVALRSWVDVQTGLTAGWTPFAPLECRLALQAYLGHLWGQAGDLSLEAPFRGLQLDAGLRYLAAAGSSTQLFVGSGIQLDILQYGHTLAHWQELPFRVEGQIAEEQWTTYLSAGLHYALTRHLYLELETQQRLGTGRLFLTTPPQSSLGPYYRLGLKWRI